MLAPRWREPQDAGNFHHERDRLGARWEGILISDGDGVRFVPANR